MSLKISQKIYILTCGKFCNMCAKMRITFVRPVNYQGELMLNAN